MYISVRPILNYKIHDLLNEFGKVMFYLKKKLGIVNLIVDFEVIFSFYFYFCNTHILSFINLKQFLK